MFRVRNQHANGVVSVGSDWPTVRAAALSVCYRSGRDGAQVTTILRRMAPGDTLTILRPADVDAARWNHAEVTRID